jgi:diguanylate cyclase (GGDEF)-like protein/PAS domain S-box-containing protein
MRIKTKLLSGYFAMATLALVVGFTALQTIRVIHHEFDVVTGHILPHISALEGLRFAGLRMIASTSELGFLTLVEAPHGEGPAEAQAQEIRLMKEGLKAYRGAAASLQDLKLADDSPEAIMRRELLAMGDRLIALGGRLLEQIQSQAEHIETFETKEALEEIEGQFLSLINQAIAQEQDDLAARRGKVLQSIFSAQSTTTVVTLLAVGAALNLGLLLAAGISGPILQLKLWAERLGQGNPGLRILPRSRDEVGDLARTFNQMAIRVEAAQSETASAHAYLEGIIRSLGEALFVLTPAGLIRSSNPAGAALLGCSESELAGTAFAELLADQAGGARTIHQVLNPTGEAPLEIALRSSSGEEVPVAVSSARLKNADGSGEDLVCMVHNLRSRKAAEETIRQLAYFDPLTGLPNRTLFQDRLAQALGRCQRENSLLALLYLDLDRFKDINDSLGHENGDLFLQTVAQRLQGCIRKSDTLARFGGDEFVILLTGAREERDVAFVAEHLRGVLAPPITLGSQEVFPTTSIGIALFPNDGESGELLLKHADMAMYAAKQKGRNTFRFFSADMHQRAQERRELEGKLRRALQKEEFFLVYQPQIDLRSGRIFGVEALLRWRHPVDGLISPAKFIPVAEETGLIRPIGEWVLRTACAQAQAWRAAGHPPLQMAVNFSGHQVGQLGLVPLVAEILRESGLPPQLLELELTESSLMENAQTTIRTLIELKSLGLQLSVDDFGTGYSSLSYLKHFPIDRLKIDQSFTRDIEADPDDRGIVEAIIGLGRSLQLQVIAEGVETVGALAILQRLGCDEAQGYYFAKPLETDALLELLTRWQPAPMPPQPVALLRR